MSLQRDAVVRYVDKKRWPHYYGKLFKVLNSHSAFGDPTLVSVELLDTHEVVGLPREGIRLEKATP